MESRNKMKNYLDLMNKVLTHGTHKDDRTGTGTISLFGEQLRFNLQGGFPIVTTRDIDFRSVVNELLFFISGRTNVNYLPEETQKWWKPWADANGGLGPIYGAQWRNWQGYHGEEYDQLKMVIDCLKTNPDSRRMIVSAWNVADIEYMALPPCHSFFQFYVSNNTLSCQMYQRSADLFLGVPANIASYALLTHMIAQVTNLAVGELIISFGDVHIYKNHVAQCERQLTRNPLQLPLLELNWEVSDIDDFTADDIELLGYVPMPAIKAKIAV
jgi:thymidylate synthase